MKLLNRKEFLKMPAGTLFMKFEPCVFGDLCVFQGPAGNNDFYYDPLGDAIAHRGSLDLHDHVFPGLKLGESMPMDFDCTGRDGLFDGDEIKFAVYEKADIEGLIAKLQTCLKEAYTKETST